MDLLPCPFCGELAEIDTGNSITCTGCPVQMIWDSDVSEKEMVQSWNQRQING